jgi:hypothetical protein
MSKWNTLSEGGDEMIEERLAKIQRELKAPKGQFNNFGKYKYRSCEDILEAVKPLLGEAVLTISDEIIMIGDRYYVKARANLWIGSIASGITVTAYAREEADKKGMDGAQITGAASSYARKYALNGLFLIDDTRDADSTNTHGKEEAKVYPLKVSKPELPKVDGMGEPLDVPEPEIPVEVEKEPLLMTDSALHKTIEGLIVQYEINRDLFKNWLYSKGKIDLKDDRPSFSTMKVAEANAMILKWNAVVTSYQKFLKKQGGE